MKQFSKNMTFYFLLSALTLFSMLAAAVCRANDEHKKTKYKLEISFLKEDTLNKVKSIITSTDSSNAIKQVKGAEVKFYAKKSFGLLPLSDAVTTDENGEAVIDFPSDLPGDSLGNIQVIAKVEDNDELGNLEDMKTVKWGIPKHVDQSFYRRALWASGANAPLPLVITVSSMVILVWGVIFYIILQVIKIQKS